MAREHMFLTFVEAANSGPYDERPMLPADIDLQIHLSRNDRPQPFFQICQHDTVLVVMAGKGRVQFKDSSVLYHHYEAGDFIYVPAGTPHRIVPDTESVHYRYTPRVRAGGGGLVLSKLRRAPMARRLEDFRGAGAGRLPARMPGVQRRSRMPHL